MKNSGAFKAGKVFAPDSKWTGEEPDWFGWETWPIEKFMKERMRMLRFYNYYLSQSDLKPNVISYMKSRGYSKSDISLFKNASPTVLCTTIGSLIRAIDKGMPSIHPQAKEYFANLPFQSTEIPRPKCDHLIISNELSNVLSILRSEEKSNSSSIQIEKPPTPNPQERLRQKVEREVISKLDEMLDSWVLTTSKVEPISLTSYIRDGNIPPGGCKFISAWIENQLSELTQANEKTCPQMVEGYSYLSASLLKNRITCLNTMLSDISKVISTRKAMKQTRVKKPKDASKQVSNLKYQPSSNDFDITSINPARIPTSHRLFLFNTKYRALSSYISDRPAGLEVKGSSLKGFSINDSFTIGLRKPKEVLNVICSSTTKQIDKYISEKVTTQKRKPNGRINPQTIILRVIETRN